MREIKFRQWLGNKFHYFELKHGLCQGVVSASLNQHPLTQFTGLHDKNGKPIYEGDIVRHIRDDEFGSEINHFVVDQIGVHIVPFCDYGDESSEYEIIGNHYENPELIP